MILNEQQLQMIAETMAQVAFEGIDMILVNCTMRDVPLGEGITLPADVILAMIAGAMHARIDQVLNDMPEHLQPASILGYTAGEGRPSGVVVATRQHGHMPSVSVPVPGSGEKN